MNWAENGVIHCWPLRTAYAKGSTDNLPGNSPDTRSLVPWGTGFFMDGRLGLEQPGRNQLFFD
jgi:hypothetical protein